MATAIKEMDITQLTDALYSIERWAADNRRELGGNVDYEDVQAVCSMARQWWWDNQKKGGK